MRRSAARLTFRETAGDSFTNCNYTGASFSQYRHPRQPKLVSGSGIYPHVNKLIYWSMPQCSPPGEFVPRQQILQQFKNPETCYEYYRRLYSLGWTTNPIGDGMKMPQNFGTKQLACILGIIGFAFTWVQWWYIVGINYPKTFTNDWAEAEVLHPRLQRSHLQRQDYVPCATLGHFDVRWPRWAKMED
eukprot:TRINITY_DN3348_c0_g1_i1.p2 TRINITY_DN3348_c0_g1~~TRINITY_DN3348_c0_g1_i1.p2  ORF type:complete len:214 (+),score=89.31 TRINITY_DN3348_c0_g1_i1:79-642(+)